MQSTDIPTYTEFGFDADKYRELQSQAIAQRMEKFSGRLYLEIGGKFFYDPHAARVLPGFDPHAKVETFRKFKDQMDMIFCVKAQDIVANRQLLSQSQSYQDVVQNMLIKLEKELGIRPFLSVNRIQKDTPKEETLKFIQHFESLGYQVFRRYDIEGYPEDTKKVLSDAGYGHDEYVPVSHKLVLVLGAASSSGKMSTCLGQMYHDTQRGMDSGYAKYETFPIWNLGLDHPVNLAYEAATADIGDFNVMDHYHEKAYGEKSVNYNRDVDAFEIVSHIAEKLLPEENFTRSYKSPTDMGINMAGFAITDDSVCCEASIAEIHRRAGWYQAQVDRDEGEGVWVERCKKLLKRVN